MSESERGGGRQVRMTGANAQELGSEGWTAGSDWRTMLGDRRGMARGRGASAGGPGGPGGP